ncbi:MAG: hypothetical protein RL186_1521 [Pseudomonadota bacterium]
MTGGGNFNLGYGVKQQLLGPNGYALAQASLEALSARSITPTPENYAVWLSFLLDDKPELSLHLRTLEEAGKPIDERVCEELYISFFDIHAPSTRVLQTGGQIAAEVEDAVRGLKEAGAKARGFGEKLLAATTKLSTTPDPKSAGQIVASLVNATAEMASESHAIEARLLESSREIETLRQQLQQVRVEASTDSLTGISNRKEFDLRFAQMAAEADATCAPLSLIMCDVDFFKRVNDTFGHQTGDQVIRFVATTMDRAKPADGVVARIGGEEFGLLAPNTSREAAMALAEQIRVAVEGKRLVRRQTNIDLGQITVSLGVSQRIAQEDPAAQMARADDALYRSKKTGRNKVCLAADTDAIAAAA